MNLISCRHCRVCGSTALTPVIDLGNQYLQGSFVKPGSQIPFSRKILLSVVRCDPARDEKACGFLQLEHTVPSTLLYSSYWYRSGINDTMRTHLKGIVDETLGIFNKREGSILDIGCNDGTLLKFYPRGFHKYGIDPSDMIQEIEEEKMTLFKGIFPSQEILNQLHNIRLDIITSIAMFYDVEDPITFARAIRNILASEGIWILEMSYLPLMLKMNAYDAICHEHLGFYTLAVVEYILKRSGLKIFNATLNDSNGGSLRCYVTHATNSQYDSKEYQWSMQRLQKEELELALETNKPYEDFEKKINAHREELSAFLKKIKNNGKTIHIYGASTKGNTILQWCGIDNTLIDCAAERNPEKFGAYTLGTNIPIVSEEESRLRNPDYYLILPWYFKKEFIEREKDILKRGTQMIFPLPKIKIFPDDSHESPSWSNLESKIEHVIRIA